MKCSNKGFTLVEIMIAIGLASALSLVIMNLTSQSNKTSAKFQSEIEATNITNEILNYLSDPLVCSSANNLGGRDTNGLPGPDKDVGLTKIRRNNGTDAYDVAGGPYGGGNLMIASYRLQDTAGDDVFSTTTAAAIIPRDLYLVINFQKKTINQTAGSTTFQRKIKIFYQTTSGNTTTIITSCKAVSSPNSDGLWTKGAGANINDIYYNLGRVGIGTPTPNGILSIRDSVGNLGNINIFGANPDFSYNGGADDIFRFDHVGAASGSTLFYHNSANILMSILNNGSVGIGTLAPNSLLSIPDNASSPGDRLFNIGDDSFFTDVDIANQLGLYGNQNSAEGGLRLGSSGSFLYGNSSGNLGISTTAPTSRLSVNGGAAIGTYAATTAAPANGLIVSGFIGAGSSAPVSTEKIHVNGDARIEGNLTINGGFIIPGPSISFNKPVTGPAFTTPSDKRLKENFVELKDSLDKILRIKTYTFYWKNKNYGSEKQIGFIAQELEKIFPELVTENKVGIRSVNYSLMVVPLIKALQEQQSEISQLKIELDKAKVRQEDLERVVCEIKPISEICK